MRRWFCLAVLAALMLGAGEAAKAEQILHRSSPVEPESLDPHATQGEYEFWVQMDLFEGLLTTGADGSDQPGAATAWEISSDSLVYTFHLRADVKWSNGDKLTAQDFVYSLRRAVDPKTASPYAAALTPIANADAIIAGSKPPSELGVFAPDAGTVVIKLARPTAYFLHILTMHIAMPVPRKAIEAYGNDWTQPGHIVSSGPFTLDRWTPQNEIVLKRNPLFHDAATVKFDEVDYAIVTDSETRLRKFETAEIDLCFEPPPEQLPRLKRDMKAALHIAPWFSDRYVIFNVSKPPFKDNLKLRQAISLVIDQATILSKVYVYDLAPGTGLVPPGISAYPAPKVFYADMSMDERVALARKLYAEAGYGPDHPLKVSLLYPTKREWERVYSAYKAMLKRALGVELTLVNREWQVYDSSTAQHDFEMAYSGWIGDYLDPFTFLQMFRTDAGDLNYGVYNNPVYDKALDFAEQTIDPATRFQRQADAEAILLKDQALLPQSFDVTHNLVNPQLVGWVDNALDLHPSRYLSFP